MQSSLPATEQGVLYAKIRELVLNKSKLIKTNYDGTSAKFFTPIIIEIATSETLCYICDYIYRPDRYMLMNPTLQDIWADFIIGVLTIRYQNEATSDGSTPALDPSNVKQLKQGDTTVIMKDSTSTTSSYPTNTRDFFETRIKPSLNRYRRLIN